MVPTIKDLHQVAARTPEIHALVQADALQAAAQAAAPLGQPAQPSPGPAAAAGGQR